MMSAPAAARCALTFGQPSRGLTILKRESAKLPIARAAMPIFSPSCGSTRITTGPVKSKPDLVLSVPEPDILTSLSDSATGEFESTREANDPNSDDHAAFAKLSEILKSVSRVSRVSERAIKAWIKLRLKRRLWTHHFRIG